MRTALTYSLMLIFAAICATSAVAGPLDSLMKKTKESKEFARYSANLDSAYSAQSKYMDSAQQNSYNRAQYDLQMHLLKNQEEVLKLADEQNDYYRRSLTHRLSTLWYQFYSSIAIFLIVISIVLAGLIFSYMQLKVSLDAMKKKTDSAAAAGAGQAEAATSFKISPGSIEVTSSVVGIIILCISIAFFYLYLIYVYPIHEISKPETTTIQATAKP